MYSVDIESESPKEMIVNKWNDSVNRYGLIGTILLLPIYLCSLALLTVLSILALPFLLLYFVAGIVFYIPISLILGISIDVIRQIFHFIFSWERFEHWKYTDKITDWWEIIPYNMSLGRYRKFKERAKYIEEIDIEGYSDLMWSADLLSSRFRKKK